MKKSFSLIELLISLIVVSLLLSAFAPLITKKLKASDITAGSFPSSSGGEGEIIDCMEGYHLYNDKCYEDTEGCINYEEGGKCTECAEGYALNNNKCTTTDLGEPTEEFCAKFGAYFIDKTLSGLNRNICMTKWNTGDALQAGNANYTAPVAIGAGAITVSVGSSCTSSGNCCWVGTTANSSNCGVTGNGNSTYSGCNRTVCQWNAANLSCLNYTPDNLKAGYWRLPTLTEMIYVATYKTATTLSQGASGLQFCDGNSASYGAVRCAEHSSNGCPGTADNRCYPQHIWTGTPGESSGTHYNYTIGGSGGIFGLQQNTNTFADSARCVYDGLNYREADNG